jgi:hypothetical protein
MIVSQTQNSCIRHIAQCSECDKQEDVKFQDSMPLTPWQLPAMWYRLVSEINIPREAALCSMQCLIRYVSRFVQPSTKEGGSLSTVGMTCGVENCKVLFTHAHPEEDGSPYDLRGEALALPAGAEPAYTATVQGKLDERKRTRGNKASLE